MRRILFAGLILTGVLSATAWYYYGKDYTSEFAAKKGTLSEFNVSPAGRDSMFEKSWLTLKTEAGFSVECGMLVPRTAGKKYSAIILLGGKATGKHAVDYAIDIDNVIIVAPDYPYAPRESYTLLEFLADVPEIRQALLDMVPAAMLVTDYLWTRADVDTTKIVLLGYSFGAPFVPCIIANDRRAAVAAIVYGGGDLRSMIQHNVARYEGPAASWFVGALSGLLLGPMEPMRFIGRISPTPLIMINGTEDEQIPRRNVELLYHAAGEPKRIRWLESRHVRPDNPELARKIVRALKEEMEKAGVLRSDSFGF
ncbi:MAG: hypothetical protein AB1428_12165 [Bacteroidota bacterium]